MAELYMKDLCARADLTGEFAIASAATSSEELGNGVYPPVRRLLDRYGIDCRGKRARQLRAADYGDYDLLLGMDVYNLRSMERLFGPDREGKVRLLMDFAGRPGQSVADPWYTRDFEAAWADVTEGCRGLLGALTGGAVFDFADCDSHDELYALLREGMGWPAWYGENLDALWDVLTGLPHDGERFVIALPRQAGPVRDYAARIRDVFREAELLV